MSRHSHEVVLVKYGTRTTTRREVFLNDFIYGEPDAPIVTDYYFWIIRTPAGPILVDTGFSEHGGAKRNRVVLADPGEAFDLLGVPPASAPRVIVTHAHYDHIGNLGLFRSSQIYVARAELDFWSGPLAARAQFAWTTETDEIGALLAAADEGRVTVVDDELEIQPGVRVVRLAGHTPGQLAVHVETAHGPVLIAADAVHYEEELDRDRPFVFVHDLAEMYRSLDTVRAMRDRGVRIIAGHDPAMLERFGPERDPGLPSLTAVVGASPTEDHPRERTSP